METRLLSNRDIIAIIEKASTFEERLSSLFSPMHDESNQALFDSRLEIWRQNAAGGDQKRFFMRLAFDHLDEESARPALSPVRWRGGDDLPDWAYVLQEVGAAEDLTPDFQGESHTQAERFLHSSQPLPFEEILIPFVLLARKNLFHTVGAAYELLSSAAHAELERNLLERLVSCASQSLYLEFSILREQALPPGIRMLNALIESDDRKVYRMFVMRMRSKKGLTGFFKEYAFLARLLAVSTLFWVEAHAEFIQRLAADRTDIQKQFGELGQVTGIKPGLSDRHRGGRGVISLVFASGLKLVYKPKNLDMDKRFYQLLDCLNHWEMPLPFKTLKLINRPAYGWVEYIEHQACQSLDEIKRYYTRAGMLLCLVYILAGTDCHNENIIASGEHPVLVDLETLMQHRVAPLSATPETSVRTVAFRQMQDSVLQTGLLPTWLFAKDKNFAYDVSGLCGDGGQELPYHITRWKNINTDDMQLKSEALQLKARDNLPVFNNTAPDSKAYSDELISGFRQMYRFLEEHRGSLLAPDSPLNSMQKLPVRFIYRNTQVYASISKQLLNPQYMRDGADYSIALERLTRAQLEGDQLFPSVPAVERARKAPLFWPILQAEKQSMVQGDIPFFTADVSGLDLQINSETTIQNCFSEPSFDRVITHLRELSPADMNRQIAFIRSSLYTRHIHADHDISGGKSAEEVLKSAISEHVSLAPEQLVARAVSIAEELYDLAIWAPDGSATWIAPQLLPEAGRYQLQPAGYNFYDGMGGIALFLAAAAKISHKNKFRELARAALKPLRQTLSDREKGLALARQIGIGGAVGLGSILYALTRTGQLLEDQEIAETACQAAGLIRPEAIQADQALDLFSGAAGAILGLLAVHETGGCREALEKALSCGRHLLENRVISDKSGYAWPTLNGKLLTGFSHGAAGIAYALLRLFQVTGSGIFQDAAAGAVLYENSCFSPEAGNWYDFRSEKSLPFMTSWCHGAPGIGLARLGGLPWLDNPEIRDNIDIALDTTAKFGLKRLDHLCCGNLGRAEIMTVGARQLSRPELSAAAAELTARVIARAEQSGGYFLNPGISESVCMPGLFQGTSGIGYFLLRSACPDLLPCVLLWE